MSLIACPECKKKVSDKAKSCPNCGYSIEKNIEEINKKRNCEKNKSGCLFTIVFFTTLLLLGSMIANIEIEDSEDISNNKKIENKKVEKNPVINSEKKLYKEILQIPASEYKKNMEGYKELLKLNPKSELYKNKYNHYKDLYNNYILNNNKKTSTIKERYNEVLKIPATNYKENMDGYKELLDLDPDSELFKEKYIHYKNLFEEKSKKEIKYKKLNFKGDDVVQAKYPLNIKFSRKSDSKDIEKIKKGESLKVLKDKGEWLFVKSENSYWGWVLKESIKGDYKLSAIKKPPKKTMILYDQYNIEGYDGGRQVSKSFLIKESISQVAPDIRRVDTYRKVTDRAGTTEYKASFHINCETEKFTFTKYWNSGSGYDKGLFVNGEWDSTSEYDEMTILKMHVCGNMYLSN